MSTFLQLLRVAFWMLPLQRALTVLGALVCLAALAFNAPGSLPGSSLPLVFCGVALMLATPLVAGGALFRMLSAPRAMQLLPHARGRLLTGMIGVVLLSTLLWILAYWAAFQRAPVQYRPDLEGYLLMFVLTLAGATQASIGLFFASRGPAWALLVIGMLQLPGMLLIWAGIDDVPRLLSGPVGLAMVPLAWLIFGTWYLKAGRIHGLGWTRGQKEAAFAGALVETQAPATREQAMERWVLGASSPRRIGLQWLLGVIVLVGVQLLLGRNSPPQGKTAMLFGTLSISALAIGAIASVIVARSRMLWLTGARLRSDLYRWCERLMLRVTFAIALPFIAIGTAMWWWLPMRPALPGLYVVLSMAAPGLAAAWFGLLQLQPRVWVHIVGSAAILAGWFYGLVQPLFTGSAEPRWGLVAAQFAVIVVLRQLSAWQWRSADWPRAQRAEPLG